MVSATTVRKRWRVAANDIRIIFQLENHGASRAATVNAQRAVDTSTSGYNTPAHVSPTVFVCVRCVCERKRRTGEKNGDKSAEGVCESASSSNHASRKVKAVDANALLRFTARVSIFLVVTHAKGSRKVEGSVSYAVY